MVSYIMSKSRWIWNDGDFELYHNMLLHNRRTMNILAREEDDARGIRPINYNCMWKIFSPCTNLFLVKEATIDKTETIVFHTNNCPKSSLRVGSHHYFEGDVITLEPGTHKVRVYAHKEYGLPAVYIEGDTFASDSSWKYFTHTSSQAKATTEYPVGHNDMYTELSDNPEIFKFSYERLSPVSTEKAKDGVLYDFGKETFAKIVINNISVPDAKFNIICGESPEEALDTKNAIVVFNAVSVDGKFESDEAVAFRYIFIPEFEGTYDIYADYEYIPLEDKGAFKCNDETINKIYDVAAYTLHLNTREGYFDGIKRDRWVWGGDAYQSYFVNYYLMNDNDSVRRTQKILRGADYMISHINTISDYTFYWLMGNWEYYFYTGDKEFIVNNYRQMLLTVKFFEERLDEEGMYIPRPDDWVFIDWSTFDKDSGPICAENMLLSRAYTCMSKCAELVGDAAKQEEFARKAKHVRDIVNERYWDEEKGGFVDDYKTGNRNITRHANIFALLYDLCSEERKKRLVECVIKNDEVTKITTPYFEFYELDAMCEIGEFKYFTDMLYSYWGGMLKHDATTFWEEYFPDRDRVGNYDMYGLKFGKSLCHAWGASPIYLIGKYIMGVKPTSPAYATYQVAPTLACLENFTGKVPTTNGMIEITMDKNSVTVLSEIDGGTLVLGDKTYAIEKNKALTVNI